MSKFILEELEKVKFAIFDTGIKRNIPFKKI